jgi:hypothetical protein
LFFRFRCDEANISENSRIEGERIGIDRSIDGIREMGRGNLAKIERENGDSKKSEFSDEALNVDF